MGLDVILDQKYGTGEEICAPHDLLTGSPINLTDLELVTSQRADVSRAFQKKQENRK